MKCTAIFGHPLGLTGQMLAPVREEMEKVGISAYAPTFKGHERGNPKDLRKVNPEEWVGQMVDIALEEYGKGHPFLLGGVSTGGLCAILAAEELLKWDIRPQGLILVNTAFELKLTLPEEYFLRVVPGFMMTPSRPLIGEESWGPEMDRYPFKTLKEIVRMGAKAKDAVPFLREQGTPVAMSICTMDTVVSPDAQYAASEKLSITSYLEVPDDHYLKSEGNFKLVTDWATERAVEIFSRSQ